MARHSIPDFFIRDMEHAGWTAKLSSFEGNTGLFVMRTGERNIISWAQLWKKTANFESWMFEPYAKVGTDWFQRSFKSIAGYNLVKGAFYEYDDDQKEGPLNRICADEYSRELIIESSQKINSWAESVDLKHALEFSALIKGAYTSPSNPFIYIVALAILGERSTLENLVDEVTGKAERNISTMVKIEHLNRALDCCTDPNKYKIPAKVIEELRGIET